MKMKGIVLVLSLVHGQLVRESRLSYLVVRE